MIVTKLTVLCASILDILLGVSVLYLEGSVLVRVIAASVFLVSGVIAAVASIDLLLEEL